MRTETLQQVTQQIEDRTSLKAGEVQESPFTARAARNLLPLRNEMGRATASTDRIKEGESRGHIAVLRAQDLRTSTSMGLTKNTATS